MDQIAQRLKKEFRNQRNFQRHSTPPQPSRDSEGCCRASSLFPPRLELPKILLLPQEPGADASNLAGGDWAPILVWSFLARLLLKQVMKAAAPNLPTGPDPCGVSSGLRGLSKAQERE